MFDLVGYYDKESMVLKVVSLDGSGGGIFHIDWGSGSLFSSDRSWFPHPA